MMATVDCAGIGSMTAVSRSSMSSMSESWISWKPRRLDPSKPLPCSSISSSSFRGGMVKCCQRPSRSVTRRSTRRTPLSSTSSSSSCSVTSVSSQPAVLPLEGRLACDCSRVARAGGRRNPGGESWRPNRTKPRLPRRYPAVTSMFRSRPSAGRIAHRIPQGAGSRHSPRGEQHVRNVREPPGTRNLHPPDTAAKPVPLSLARVTKGDHASEIDACPGAR